MTLTPTRSPASSRPRLDPEALIEEARRRARRRRARWAAVFVIGLVLSGTLYAGFHGGSGTNDATRAQGDGGRAANRIREERAMLRASRRGVVGDAGVAGPGIFWADNGLAIWITEDDGGHWRTVTPPHVREIGDPIARISQIQFINNKVGWISAVDVIGGYVPPPHSAYLRHMEIDRTTDGGKTWSWALLPGCAACGGARISFLNAREGYALTAGTSIPILYRTRNGGAAWSVVSHLPFNGSIAFTNSLDGFGVSQSNPIAGGVLFGTTDGGRRWTRVVLPTPQRYRGEPQTADLPTFFGPNRGVVSVRYLDRPSRAQHLVVFTTSNGGSTWTARPAPVEANLNGYQWGIPNSIPFSAASARTWTFIAHHTNQSGNEVVFQTTDAGQHWSSVVPRFAPTRSLIWIANFTSGKTGWAIFDVNPRNGGPVLVHTSDAGRDWTPRQPPMRLQHLKPLPPKCGSACRRP